MMGWQWHQLDRMKIIGTSQELEKAKIGIH